LEVTLAGNGDFGEGVVNITDPPKMTKKSPNTVSQMQREGDSHYKETQSDEFETHLRRRAVAMTKTRNNSHRTRINGSAPPEAASRTKEFLNLKSILAPVDFSHCCRKAVQYAVLMARDYGARIILVHIAGADVGNEKRLKVLERELNEFAKREVGTQAPVTTVVKQGDPLREIIDITEAEGVDLLVISTHARTGLPDFCMGSAAEQIVRYAPCPVLVVREHEHDFASTSKPSRDSRNLHFQRNRCCE
jgi:nucleotide-binding universal stress UspA family protein